MKDRKAIPHRKPPTEPVEVEMLHIVESAILHTERLARQLEDVHYWASMSANGQAPTESDPFAQIARRMAGLGQ